MAQIDCGDYVVFGMPGEWRVRTNYGSVYVYPDVYTELARAVAQARR